ncbi:MAG: sulfatase-like hydrolase/transferase [Bryobacteraceae bacterium]|nr:sulfatase-like hydrolase/transferase [Solibacteraceae bacterium]MCO5352659.1 sulfatase-like hydrolase/transferase [Bryobacteraceae bacterium]
MKTTRRHVLQSAAAIAAAPALHLRGAQPSANRPPNILFLYTDDQACWGANAYGFPEPHTPNMDRIGAAGALFENAFVTTPVCSPSRASLFTSQPSFRTGIRDFLDYRREPELGLSEHFPTWPLLLRQSGYRTGLFGKWHLGTRPEHHPTRRGFHEFMGFLEGGNNPMDPFLEIEGKTSQIKGPLPDLLTDAALGFMKRHQSQPFLATVHFRAPHSPYGPVPEADTAAVADRKLAPPNIAGLDVEDVLKRRRGHYASIASVDRNVGRMLDALDSWGLASNTLVICTSDNGYMIGHHGALGKGNATSMLPARNRLPNMFEDSIRVPMYLRWPGRVRPGTRIREMVTNLDYFPSLLRIAGATAAIPEGYLPCGRDFTPLLLGEKAPWRNTVFGDYDMYHYFEDSMRMIRTERWKLVTHSHIDVAHELYDLRQDPGETRNLIGSFAHGDVKIDLRRKLYAWQTWMGDPRRRAPWEEM